ncbi:MAG TPA: MMPL family transporter, partial [Candidatus Polarisedimenticolia bacterium]|nr:MMPL family transporter [Candidatus Polarisedimenticolia bacterium]
MAQGRKGLFLRIEDLSRRHYRAVFLVTLLLVVVSGIVAKRLRLDGDVLNLVPKNNRKVNTFKEALQDFGSLDYLLVMVDAPPPHGATGPAPAGGESAAPADEEGDEEAQAVEEVQAFADILAARLQKLPSVRYVEYKLDTSGPFFDFLRRNQMLFLPSSRMDDLAAKFSDAAIRARVAENRRQLTGPASLLAKQLLQADPLQITPLLFDAVLRNRGPIRFDASSGGYFSSRDGRALLLVVKPIKPCQDLPFSRTLVNEVNGAIRGARDEFVREAHDPGASVTPDVDLGGGYVVALEDSNLIMQDMWLNGVLSFVVIVGLYYFCYRRFAAIAYSSLPLVVGQALTFGVAWIVLRQLNSATTGFTAMLMGLGTDFTIVMYARYVEERQRGLPLDAAMQKVFGSSAFGVFTGAVTSAGTFYAMCITEYKGLRDFGFLVGTGILLCMVAILFMLPAMIAWNDGRERKKDITKKLYLHSFGFERAMIWSARHPAPVLIGSLLVTLFAGWHAWHVEFSDSVQDLRSPNNKGVR